MPFSYERVTAVSEHDPPGICLIVVTRASIAYNVDRVWNCVICDILLPWPRH